MRAQIEFLVQFFDFLSTERQAVERALSNLEKRQFSIFDFDGCQFCDMTNNAIILRRRILSEIDDCIAEIEVEISQLKKLLRY